MSKQPRYYAENGQVFERSGDTATCIAIGNNDDVAAMIVEALNDQTLSGLSKYINATRTLASDMRRQIDRLADRADGICDAIEKGAKRS